MCTHTYTHIQISILMGPSKAYASSNCSNIFPHIYIVTLWTEIHKHLANTEINTIIKIKEGEAIFHLTLKDNFWT